MTSGMHRASMSMAPKTDCSASTLWGIWRSNKLSSMTGNTSSPGNSWSLAYSRGYFFPEAKPTLEHRFPENTRKKHPPKESPQIRARRWGRHYPTTAPLRPTTPKRASEQRAGHKPGGPGGNAPGALSSGFLRRKPGSPPESAGIPPRRVPPAPVPTGTYRSGSPPHFSSVTTTFTVPVISYPSLHLSW